MPAARAAAVAAAAFSRLCAPADQRLGRQRVVGRELDPFEPEAARDDLRPRPLEDAQLRVPVGRERAVPVEVVGLEVEQNGDVAGELVDVFELERGQLADDPVRLARPRSAACRRSLPQPRRGPPARKIAPSSSAVVVLPFVPVTPTNLAPGSSRKPSSTSDHTGIPRSRAAATSGASPGTPGDFTSTSTPSSSERSSSFPSDAVDRRPSSPRSTARGRRPDRARP